MANILDRLMGTMKQGKEPSVDLDQPAVKQMLDLLGLDAVQLDKGRKELILVPKGIKSFGTDGGAYDSNSPMGFFQYWLDNAMISQDQVDVEKGRAERYLEYSVMDDNSAESALSLDTYADESLASGRTHESPVDIEISDSKFKEQVITILKAQQILSESHQGFASHRSTIRTLAKYGDIFHQFIRHDKKSPIQIQKIRDPAHIMKVWDPTSQATLMFKKTMMDGKSKENLMPWEICHYAIPDDQFHPYGRSILEPMRAPYKQLIINEALMALSRSSKVERLVIRVPTTSNNPTSVWAQLISAKAQMKNAIFGSSDGTRSKSRIAALTDVLWMPGSEKKEYGIDRLQSSIDVSSIDDVEYFRDKMLMATRLPKGYLLADQVIRIDEGALAQQDLKFSRSLLPLQFGYVDGLTWEIICILVILGADMEKVKVSVKVDKPQALSRAMVSGAEEAIRSVDALVESFTKATQSEDSGYGGRGGGGDEPVADPPKKMDPKAWVWVTRAMTGLPVNLLEMVAGVRESKGNDKLTPMSEIVEQYIIEETRNSYMESTSDVVIPSWGYSFSDLRSQQVAKGYTV